jgi:hypothetical protein
LNYDEENPVQVIDPDDGPFAGGRDELVQKQEKAG